MTEERVLVTGALGCIGAWVVRNLVREQVPTTILDVGGSDHRLRLVMDDAELAQVRLIRGDIADLAAVEAALAESGANRIIHLAALQVPFCKADPPRGARVNVLGTVNLFEAARRAGIGRLVYASSIAVFGRSEDYDGGALADDARQLPSTHYGVYKQANEGTARIYWQDDGISSIALRPFTIYGPGRDQGLTSATTRAMVAAAAGRPYTIPFSGVQGMQYADDCARMFIQAARAPFQGAAVFNLRGSVASMADVVAAIEAVEPAARGTIAVDGPPLPFPEQFDDSGLRAALGEPPFTPLEQGVAESIARFKAAIVAGRMDPATYLSH